MKTGIILISLATVQAQDSCAATCADCKDKCCGTLKKLQEVYECIFCKCKGDTLDLGFQDRMKYSGYRKSEADADGDPHKLDEAEFEYSVNNFWRECEWQDNGREEGLAVFGEIADAEFKECINRTHMAEWMEWHITRDDPHIKDPETGYPVKLKGQLDQNYNILDEIKSNHNKTKPEKELFGTTLMALCFYKLGYSSEKYAEGSRAFQNLCVQEFANSCNEDSLALQPINLYFCDKVADRELKKFLRKVQGQTFRDIMANT